MNPALRRSVAHVFVADLDAPALEPDDEHHLARVLRVRAGEVVSASDGRGSWRLCELAAGGGLRSSSPIESVARPAPAITVGFVVPKGDRPEWIVQKLTELGVDRIALLRSERSVVVWDSDRAAKQVDRLRRVAREAAMQSRLLWQPQIEGPLPLTSFDPAATVLAEPGGGRLEAAGDAVLIGPEGGWAPAELARFPRRVGLGSTVLRVETAALAAAVGLCAMRDHNATA